LCLAVAPCSFAQGRGNGKGASNGNGNPGNGPANGNPHQTAPPSSSPLPAPASAPVIVSATPVAWLDDATLVPPGSVLLTVSAMKWSGTDLSEVDLPIVEGAFGITPRLQIGATVPHVVGNDVTNAGPEGGLGTSYFSTKIALPTGDRGLKVAVAPMLQVLGESATQTLAPDQSRSKFGLPINAEVSHGAARVFGSAGFFSGGTWFWGAGIGMQVAPRLGISTAITRAWAANEVVGLVADRRELSGGLSYLVGPRAAVFGSIGTTVATAAENGAGVTVSMGLTMMFSPSPKKPS
jgi:hypothetical protein